MADNSEYADLQHIESELDHARKIYRKHPDWTVLDITRRAVEETASDLVAIYQTRFGTRTI